MPKNSQDMAYRHMIFYGVMDNTQFAAYCTLIKTVEAALTDAATSTVYSSRIDGALLPR